MFKSISSLVVVVGSMREEEKRQQLALISPITVICMLKKPALLIPIGAQAGEDALDLLARMVAFDPRRRITAEEALAHRFFRDEPAPTPPRRLPPPPMRDNNPLKLAPQVPLQLKVSLGATLLQTNARLVSREGQRYKQHPWARRRLCHVHLVEQWQRGELKILNYLAKRRTSKDFDILCPCRRKLETPHKENGQSSPM